jgi:act minimal PKS acyl carrier protein
MSTLTLETLKQLMRTCGVSEETDLDSDITQVTFEELDYDSLALLQILAQIENRFGLRLSEDDLDKMRTPEALLNFVNGLLIGA